MPSRPIPNSLFWCLVSTSGSRVRPAAAEPNVLEAKPPALSLACDRELARNRPAGYHFADRRIGERRGYAGRRRSVAWPGRQKSDPMLISGHEGNKSLEFYQHPSPETVAEAYQEVIKSVGI